MTCDNSGLGGKCRNTRRFTLLAHQELEFRRYGVGNNEALLVQLQPLQGACAPHGSWSGTTLLCMLTSRRVRRASSLA